MKFWSNSDIPTSGIFVPEKRLLAAVLQRAITDFISGDGELKDGARLWLLEDESCADAPLSFRFICEALDLDLSSLRKAIFMQEEAATAATATAANEMASSDRVVARAAVQAHGMTPIVGNSSGAVVSSAIVSGVSGARTSASAGLAVASGVVSSVLFQEAAL